MSTRTEEVIADAVFGSGEQREDGLAGESSAARPAIPYGRHWISESDIDAMVAVLRSDFVTQGEQVPAFERELGEVLGADSVVALGRSQLKRRDQLLSRRRRLARRYCEAFQQSPYSEWIILPPEDSGHAYHLFIIHLADARIRDRVHGQLRRMGIMTQVHYLPLYRHTYYRDQVESCAFAGAEAYFDGCLSIPLYPRMRD